MKKRQGFKRLSGPALREQLTTSTKPNGSPTEADTRRRILLLIALFVSALVLRLVFVHEVIEQNTLLYPDLQASTKAGFLTADSDGYIKLARNFLAGYFTNDLRSYALFRTPGYPAFCAVFYDLNLAPGGILIAQAVLGAFIPVLTLMLALMLTGNLFFSCCAGFLSAVSPTGIGLCGLIMNDVLLAFLMSAGVYLFFFGMSEGRSAPIINAGLVLAAAFLVKPILAFWPLVMIAIYYIFRHVEIKRPNWRALFIAVAIQLIILGLWCTRNYIYEEIFTPSSVIIDNLHDFIRPRVEEWVKTGGLPQNQSVRRNRDDAVQRVEQQTAGMPLREKLDLKRTRSLEVFREHPWVTLQVILQNIKENSLSGYDYFQRSLPLGTLQQDRLLKAVFVETLFRETTLILVALFFPILLIYAFVKHSETNRRLAVFTTILIFVFSYFAALSGSTFWVGSRILYPVEFVMILLFVVILQSVGTFCRKLAGSAGLVPEESALVAKSRPARISWIMALCFICVGIWGAFIIVGKDSETYSNFGKALVSRGGTSESVHWFEKALQISPESLQPKFNLALVYIRLEKFGEAVPLLREVVRAKPRDANANYFLGASLVHSGSYEEGLKHIRDALHINPQHEDAREILNRLNHAAKDEPLHQGTSESMPQARQP